MSARTTSLRIATLAPVAALVGGLLAPGSATAVDPTGPVVNGGIVTDTNYVGPDGTVRELPIARSTTSVRVFSPNGAALAHVEEPDAAEQPNELWILGAGGDASKLADLTGAPVYDMAWSRDGDSIAVTSAYYRPRSDETRSFLHVVDTESGIVSELADTTWDRNVRFAGVAWSHDGQRVALSVSDSYYEAEDVMWVSATDGSVTPLTNNCVWADWEVADDCGYELVTGGYRGLDMHPDGSRLITMDHTGVYTVDTSTGTETVLRNDGRNYNQLQWSPDGNRIAWTAVEDWGDSFKVVVHTDSVAGGTPTAVATNVGSAWDWQPCTDASCPAFGSLREDVIIKLKETRYSARWVDIVFTIRSAADRKPVQGASELPVVFQRRAGGTWKKVFSNVAYAYDGAYETRFRRPAPGTCRMKVTFPGDHGHEPAKAKLALPRC